MKAITTLFCVSVLIIILKSTSGSEDDERIKSMYAKCKTETQWDENEMDAMKNTEVPMSQKGKCMMGCLMRESGIIVNGKFDKGGAMKVVEKQYSDKSDEMEKAKAVVDTCEKQVENETEECNVAGKLATCVLAEAQKTGLTSVPRG